MTFVAIQCFKTRASEQPFEVSVRGGDDGTVVGIIKVGFFAVAQLWWLYN